MALGKTVLKGEDFGNVVFEFKAKEIAVRPGSSAEQFIDTEASRANDFKIDPLAAEQAGIAGLQRQALNDRIEEEALAQIKEVQEKAYREAYQLGLTEGREQAFAENQAIIEKRLIELDKILLLLEEYKARLVADHETHIVQMIYGLARRIAVREIEENQDSILGVLLQVVADAQSEETVTIRVSAEDFKFLETLRAKGGKAAEPLQRVKLEVGESMTSGGCVLISNYGSIDASIETRVERAWKTLSDRLPKKEMRSDSDGGDGHGS